MSPAAATPAAGCTCTACGLVCDDIVPADDRFARACPAGAQAVRAAGAPGPEAWIDGRPTDRDTAVAAAAALLARARRVLVTGFGGATVEAVAAACDVAEALGAAVDAGAAECDRPAGPTIARAGEVTADWEELRDRADLVVFWRCDPGPLLPRFAERFLVPPPVAGPPRRVVVVGDAWPAPPEVRHEHVPLDRGESLEAARELHTILGGRHLPRPLPRSAGSPAAAAERLAAAIDAARCVAIVTADDDPVGLVGWGIAHLVRTIAHVKPAFEIPLGGPGRAGGRGAAAVCTWRYGAAGAIAAAHDGPVSFLPGEASARRLVARGEVDAVLVVGRAAAAVEAALAAAAGRITVVRIDDGAALSAEPRTIRLACASTAAETAGTMLRGDGRTVRLAPVRSPRLPQLPALLAAVRGRLPPRQRPAAADGGAA